MLTQSLLLANTENRHEYAEMEIVSNLEDVYGNVASALISEDRLKPKLPTRSVTTDKKAIHDCAHIVSCIHIESVFMQV
jgi:hypothetical protein